MQEFTHEWLSLFFMTGLHPGHQRSRWHCLFELSIRVRAGILINAHHALAFLVLFLDGSHRCGWNCPSSDSLLLRKLHQAVRPLVLGAKWRSVSSYYCFFLWIMLFCKLLPLHFQYAGLLDWAWFVCNGILEWGLRALSPSFLDVNQLFSLLASS